MDINRLRVFVNLVETRNYTRTAANLHISQPMVTHNIKAIEDEIGIKLFDRSTKYVHVTSNGEEFYNKIKPMINRYYLAVQTIREKDYSEQNTITIGFSSTPFNELYIPQWIKDFKKQKPETKFYVESLNHNKLKQYLETNEIDILFTSEGDASDLSNSQNYPLISDSFFAVMPKSNHLAQYGHLKIDDFHDQKMIFIDNNWTGVEMIELQRQIIHDNPHIDITYANDIVAANILVNAEEGISLGLNFIYPHSNDRLAYVPLNWKGIIRYVAVLHKNNDKHCVHEFVKFIQQDLSN